MTEPIEVPAFWLLIGGFILYGDESADYGDGLYMDVDSDGDMRAIAPRPVLTFLAQGGYTVSMAALDIEYE